MKHPSVIYPTLIRGYIKGPIRCESIDGSELWLPSTSGRLKIKPFVNDESFQSTKPQRFYANIFTPASVDNKTYFVTHLQKKATFFSLLYDPFIYHFGTFWKTQEYLQNPDGGWGWKSNSERGIYWRTPGWRWQVPDEKSNGTTWIWSGGRVPGAHLD